MALISINKCIKSTCVHLKLIQCYMINVFQLKKKKKHLKALETSVAQNEWDRTEKDRNPNCKMSICGLFSSGFCTGWKTNRLSCTCDSLTMLSGLQLVFRIPGGRNCKSPCFEWPRKSEKKNNHGSLRWLSLDLSQLMGTGLRVTSIC